MSGPPQDPPGALRSQRPQRPEAAEEVVSIIKRVVLKKVVSFLPIETEVHRIDTGYHLLTYPPVMDLCLKNSQNFNTIFWRKKKSYLGLNIGNGKRNRLFSSSFPSEKKKNPSLISLKVKYAT